MKDFLQLPDLVDRRVGGEVLAANDEFFAPKENLVKPGEAVWLADEYTERGKWMDGWETRRRREPGHDWAILRLGLPGVLQGVVVDTTYFRGNYPESCSIDACDVPEGMSLEALTAPAGESAVEWREILGQSMLEGNSKNHFTIEDRGRITHIRLNIYPDGGVARLRAHGRSARSLALEAGLRRLQSADDARFMADMLACCGARAWAAAMGRARPFSGIGALFAHADTIWAELGHEDWREAFAAHPRIGESKAGRDRFARWSTDEQSGVAASDAELLDQLARANEAYRERFGYIFIVFASGKSAPEMLSLLRRRLDNPAGVEIAVAAAEQAKITRSRLQKLLLALAEAETGGDNQA